MVALWQPMSYHSAAQSFNAHLMSSIALLSNGHSYVNTAVAVTFSVNEIISAILSKTCFCMAWFQEQGHTIYVEPSNDCKVYLYTNTFTDPSVKPFSLTCISHISNAACCLCDESKARVWNQISESMQIYNSGTLSLTHYPALCTNRM